MERSESEAENTAENSSEKNKVKKVGQYPARDLGFAISFVAKIYTELGGSDFHDKFDIARAQNLAYNSIKQTLGTCQLYNLLELKFGVGYRPTSLFVSIYLPKSEEEKYNSVIKSLTAPPIYKDLIEKFQGHVLPQISGLTNTLVREYYLKQDIAKKAAEIFLDNLKTYNLLNQRNILHVPTSFRISSIELPDQNEYLDEIETKNTEGDKKRLEKQPEVEDSEMLDILIPLKSTNKKAHLFIPENYKEEDLERILKFVEALK